MSTLGHYIKSRREELGLTQEELANRVGIGVRQADISRLENNHVKSPRLSRLERLADALDAPVGVLLSKSGWIGAEEEITSTLSEERRSHITLLPSAPDQLPEAIEKLNQVKELVEEVQVMIDEAGGPVSPMNMNVSP